MNERIHELAKQAGDYVNEVYTPPVRSKTPGKIWEDGHVDWYTQFNEKFAELIVRECALTAGLMEHEGRPNIGAQILDNFGVES
jgi:hypothetical protein